MKKALAILGSPRDNGNAAKLLNIAINSAKQAGYQIQKIDLYKQHIGVKGVWPARKLVSVPFAMILSRSETAC